MLPSNKVKRTLVTPKIFLLYPQTLTDETENRKE